MLFQLLSVKYGTASAFLVDMVDLSAALEILEMVRTDGEYI